VAGQRQEVGSCVTFAVPERQGSCCLTSREAAPFRRTILFHGERKCNPNGTNEALCLEGVCYY
jgi:hypothetical protein